MSDTAFCFCLLSSFHFVFFLSFVFFVNCFFCHLSFSSFIFFVICLFVICLFCHLSSLSFVFFTFSRGVKHKCVLSDATFSLCFGHFVTLLHTNGFLVVGLVTDVRIWKYVKNMYDYEFEENGFLDARGKLWEPL